MKRTTYKYVKERKGSIGKRCLRCRESATVTAMRNSYGKWLPVWYCAEHWDSVRPH